MRISALAILCCWAFLLIGQDSLIDHRWQQIEERISYGQSARPKGPADKYNYPEAFSQNDPGDYYEDYESVSPEDIELSREQRFQKKGNNGIQQKIHEDENESMEDLTSPDIESPSWDGPDWDGPDIDPPRYSANFWKTIFIVIAIILVALLIYYFFVRQGPLNYSPAEDYDGDWDPTQVASDELVDKLDVALKDQNYRLCVRIYYTMILKELVNKNLIHWERKKTNQHYILELGDGTNRKQFEEVVRIFELVWYGDYAVKTEEYMLVSPKLKAFHLKLKND